MYLKKKIDQLLLVDDTLVLCMSLIRLNYFLHGHDIVQLKNSFCNIWTTRIENYYW